MMVTEKLSLTLKYSIQVVRTLNQGLCAYDLNEHPVISSGCLLCCRAATVQADQMRNIQQKHVHRVHTPSSLRQRSCRAPLTMSKGENFLHFISYSQEGVRMTGFSSFLVAPEVENAANDPNIEYSDEFKERMNDSDV